MDVSEEGAGAGGVSGELFPAHTLLEGGPAGVGVDGLDARVGGEAEDLLCVAAVAGFDGGEDVVEAAESGGEEEVGGGTEALVADLFLNFGIAGFGGLAVAFAEFEPDGVGKEDAGVELGLFEVEFGLVEAV